MHMPPQTGMPSADPASGTESGAAGAANGGLLEADAARARAPCSGPRGSASVGGETPACTAPRRPAAAAGASLLLLGAASPGACASTAAAAAPPPAPRPELGRSGPKASPRLMLRVWRAAVLAPRDAPAPAAGSPPPRLSRRSRCGACSRTAPRGAGPARPCWERACCGGWLAAGVSGTASMTSSAEAGSCDAKPAAHNAAPGMHVSGTQAGAAGAGARRSGLASALRSPAAPGPAAAVGEARSAPARAEPALGEAAAAAPGAAARERRPGRPLSPLACLSASAGGSGCPPNVPP